MSKKTFGVNTYVKQTPRKRKGRHSKRPNKNTNNFKKVQRKNTEDKVDNFVATNWHLKFRLEIEELKKKLEQVTIERNIALRKLKKLKVKNEHKTTV